MNIKAATMIVVAMLSLAACTTPNPRFCDADTPCTSRESPFCDLRGEFPASEGVANRCIPSPGPPDTPGDGDSNDEPQAPECDEAGSFLRCDGDLIVRCNSDRVVETDTCAFGCNSSAGGCNECTPNEVACRDETFARCDDAGVVVEESVCALGCSSSEVRCNQMVPSNGLEDFLTLAAEGEDFDLAGLAMFDTTLGTLRNDGAAVLIPSFEVAAPANGVPLRVFVARSFRAEDIIARGTHAFVLVSSGEIGLTGELVTSAGKMPPSAPCTGGNGTDNAPVPAGSEYFVSGAGGAGSRHPGGAGGAIEFGLAGGLGGAAFVNPDLQPLRGGCSGGVIDAFQDTFEIGNGRGAAQLVSATSIRLSSGALLDASAPEPFGQGGGSGGGLLLEAPIISLASGAGLFANGAGGSGPCGRATTGASENGERGQRSTAPARGADCKPDDPFFGFAGDGGANDTPPTAGELLFRDGRNDMHAGSGGGSAGYIRLNTRDGSFQLANDVRISPVESTGLLNLR